MWPSDYARSRPWWQGRAPTEVKALLVASPGGHIEELRLLASQFPTEPGEVHWVTSRSPQTESLLRDEVVHWIDPIASGDLARAARALPSALRLHRSLRPELVVSTGAAAAAPHLVAASLSRCPVWYVESATRLHGPSQTGRLVERLPGVTRFAQGEGWGDPRWITIPDVFTAFEVVDRVGVVPTPHTAVVSLGSERFPFERAVVGAERVLDGFDVYWQTGSTKVERDGTHLPQWVPADALRQAFRDADVVITHGGVGSALVALSEGKVPIVLARRANRGEHIDDHQLEVCELLADRGLAVCADPDELSSEHIAEAAAKVARVRAPVETS
jgi:UDP-N-acetylglucosamine--N-acetylmuramyl-(pentapeptide) pyrophosphoryl-undecaprenol N-acetylglucosamine transferase